MCSSLLAKVDILTGEINTLAVVILNDLVSVQTRVTLIVVHVLVISIAVPRVYSLAYDYN